MHIKSFVFNAFYENTYLLSADNKETYIIDPGCYETFEKKEIVSYIEKNKLNPIGIINTHCHIDHVLGNYYLKDFFKIPIWIPAEEQSLLKATEAYAPNWGITGYQSSEPDRLIKKDEKIKLGEEILNVKYAPGHSPGHLMFYNEKAKVLIAGDVIFRESIGRTDLPGGDFETLEASIKREVYSLPSETIIYPGHGPSTTVGHEMVSNPFVKI